MTVALAALCGYPNDVYIVAAADQMITSGDIQFEQPQPKMWRLSEHCFAMMYGLSAAQAQIAADVEAHVLSKGYTSVRVISQVYSRLLRDYVRKEAEADVLAPLDLSSFDLIRNPATISPSQLRRLSQQMQSYYDRSGLADDLGGAIIVGVDDVGSHIYGIEHGHMTCYDTIGFAAAGGGQWHASSQFMFAGYTRFWEFTKALSLTYSAKKRAEVAPGVGTQTDIVIVTSNPRNVIHARYDSDFVLGLEKIYQDSKKKIDAEVDGQHASVKRYFDELMEKWAAEAPPPTPPPETQATRQVPQSPKRAKKSQPPSRE